MKQVEAGFTIVEVIVALVISVLFLVGIYSAATNTLRISTGNSQRMTASNIAYANLRQYANGKDITWYGGCTTTTSTQIWQSTAAVNGLPAPTTQTVTASAPYGCPAPNAFRAVKLISTVEYGSSSQKVVHAIFTY